MKKFVLVFALLSLVLLYSAHADIRLVELGENISYSLDSWDDVEKLTHHSAKDFDLMLISNCAPTNEACFSLYEATNDNEKIWVCEETLGNGRQNTYVCIKQRRK